DGYSCSSCHATHTILRIAPERSAGAAEDPLIVNYNSVQKVVNLGDPGSSLLLRKPRSPQGQGDNERPTGLTHVGGPRWHDDDHRAFQAILKWIRGASQSAPDNPGAHRLTADSFAPGYEPALAGDGDTTTLWRTEFIGGTPGYPHQV